MTRGPLDGKRCREYAGQFRLQAAMSASEQLRNTYEDLAFEYERLAETLDRFCHSRSSVSIRARKGFFSE
jgi:hypothetical protein